MRTLLALVGAALAVCPLGCAPPDLGAAPFFCNNGSPKCPEGYSCVPGAGREVCVKDGISPRQLRDAAAVVNDASVDQSPPDVGLVPDVARPPDFFVPDTLPADQTLWPDLGVPPDSAPPPDQGHLGCQSHSECSADAPCCCPLPLLPGLWGCLPLCLDPICF